MTTPRKGATRGEIPLNLSVDEAVAETIHRTPGCHPKEIAALIGRSHRYVLDVADDQRDAQLKINEIAPVVNGTHNTLMLDVLERQVGRVAYDIPVVDVTDVDVMTRCAAVLKETADVVGAIAGCSATAALPALESPWGFAPGDVVAIPRTPTAFDAARIEREAEQAIQAILSAVAFVRAKAQGSHR